MPLPQALRPVVSEVLSLSKRAVEPRLAGSVMLMKKFLSRS